MRLGVVIVSVVIAMVIILGISNSAYAAVDMFLKIGSIPGESSDLFHPDEIEIFSFSFGVSNSGTTIGVVGGSAGRPSFQDIHFTKQLDKSSPFLFLNVATGKYEAMANFVVRSESSGVEVLRIQLEDTLVTSYQIGGSGGDIVPTDSFSLNFSKIEFEYTPHKDGKAGSPIKTGYDLTTSTKT